MRLVAVACVRDEIDIIEPFVRHTLAFADRLVVLDNGSTDGTLTVLKQLHAEGLPLEIVEDPAPGKQLAQRVNGLTREFALERYQADWVLPLDADEFVCVPADGPLIVAGMSPEKPYQLCWRTYVPDDSDDPAQINPVLRMCHRLEQKRVVSKVLLPAALAGRPGAEIMLGNHALTLDGRPCPGTECPHAYLAHFPVRTPGQLVAKAVIGYLQNLVMPLRNPAAAFHHQDNFEQLKQDPVTFTGSFTRAARHYACPPHESSRLAVIRDPLPYRGGPLCHTPRVDDAARTWQPILRYVEGLAHEYGLLRHSLSDDQCVDFDRLAAVCGHLNAHLCKSIASQRDTQTLLLRCQETLQDAHKQLQAERAKTHAASLRHRETLEQVQAEREKAHAAQVQLAHLQGSWSWKVGRLALEPVRVLRKLAHGVRACLYESRWPRRSR